MKSEKKERHRWSDLSVGTDEAGQADDSTVGEQLCHFGDSSDVLLAISWTESEVLVEAKTDVVSVQTVGRDSLAHEVFLKGKRYRCLSGSRQTFAYQIDTATESHRLMMIHAM